MLCTSNIKEFVQQTSLPESLNLIPCSDKISRLASRGNRVLYFEILTPKPYTLEQVERTSVFLQNETPEILA